MNNTILKIGHRGACAYVAENTLESIKKALALGVDGIEIDVHACGSGELIVFHDFTLDRMTNGTGELGVLSLSELKNLTVNGNFLIPTLQEVLDLLDKNYLINIELKGRDTAKKATEIIKFYIKEKGWKYSHFIVSSFQYHELETVFKIDENIPLGVLTKASVADAIEFAQTVNAKALHPNYALLTQENVKYAQAQGYKINTWTVNDSQTISRMKQYGVDAIISDYPDRL